jgi:hypothetical protein
LFKNFLCDLLSALCDLLLSRDQLLGFARFPGARQVGQKMQSQTTEAGFAAALAGWEKDTLPLDLQGFNRYHHGGKVNAQDRQHLRGCIAYGEAEGKTMAALKELLQRAEARQQSLAG